MLGAVLCCFHKKENVVITICSIIIRSMQSNIYTRVRSSSYIRYHTRIIKKEKKRNNIYKIIVCKSAWCFIKRGEGFPLMIRGPLVCIEFELVFEGLPQFGHVLLPFPSPLLTFASKLKSREHKSLTIYVFKTSSTTTTYHELPVCCFWGVFCN